MKRNVKGYGGQRGSKHDGTHKKIDRYAINMPPNEEIFKRSHWRHRIFSLTFLIVVGREFSYAWKGPTIADCNDDDFPRGWFFFQENWKFVFVASSHVRPKTIATTNPLIKFLLQIKFIGNNLHSFRSQFFECPRSSPSSSSSNSLACSSSNYQTIHFTNEFYLFCITSGEEHQQNRFSSVQLSLRFSLLSSFLLTEISII